MLTVPTYTHVPCLVAIADCSHVHNVLHYTRAMSCCYCWLSHVHTHAMSCCYCWLYPRTQCYTLHTCHVLLLLLTVPRTQCSTLHTCHVLLLLLTVPTYTMFYTTHMPCLVAIVDYTHARAMSYCYCWLYPCRDSCNLPQGLGNSCTGELHQPNIYSLH